MRTRLRKFEGKIFPYRLPPFEDGEAGVALFIHCSQELPQGLHDQSRAIHFKGAI